MIPCADTESTMVRSSRDNPSKEMITVYGKIAKAIADKLDALADRRRWSRAQMVAFCIEQFVEKNEPDERGGNQK